MKNETNIYDIDGNIIRKAGDNHRFTIEEVEKLVDDLSEKVKQNPDNEVYKVYLDNAHKWLMYMYNNMSKEDIAKRISALQNNIQDAKNELNEAEQKQLEEINKAMEQLKAEYDADQSDSTTVLEDERPGTVMDEYVEPIEEIKSEQ
jgi:AAA+ ATPase superfamily predicted ATPase